MAQAQELVEKGKKKVTQDELEGTTAILNRAINTMRPGNLAEMEDLRELSGLLRRAGLMTTPAMNSRMPSVMAEWFRNT